MTVQLATDQFSDFIHTESETEDETHMYRVQFSTPTVKPGTFPNFPYVATEVAFDHVKYTAVIRAATTQEAIATIMESWPGAEVRYIQPNMGEFKRDDVLIKNTWFGTMIPRKQEGWLTRIVKAPFAWAF